MADRTDDPRRSDEALDALLQRVGARWRDDNAEPAVVDPSAVAGIASARGPRPDDAQPAAGEPRPGAGEALPLVPDPVRSGGSGWRRSRTGRTALAAVAAAAVVAGLTVGLLQLTGGSGSGHRAAAGGPVSSAPAPVSTAPGDVAGAAVIGPDWQLRGLTGPDGTARPVTVPAHFQISGSGLTFSDGCNSGGGQATVTGSTISFAKLIHTTMACASSQPGQSQQEQLIDAVVAGSVHWAVQAGVLTLSKPGVGTLSYTAAPATPTVNPDSVFAGTWYLQTVQPGDNIAQPYGTAVSAPPGARLTWGAGGLTGSDGCNSFRADYRYIGAASDASLTISNLSYVPPIAPCPQGYSEWTQVLTGVTHATRSGDTLDLTDAHGGALTFTRAATGGSGAGSQSPSGAPSRP